MKTLAFFGLCVVVAFAHQADLSESGVPAAVCSTDICLQENGCRCANSKSPLPDRVIPQLISLTFDEAVTNDIYDNYWSPLLFSRVNPDGQPIGATFFVPHEYTDYQRVNDLYNYGFEIGVHSITKNNFQEYWRNATEQLLEDEFGGQKHIISKFANIPSQDIVGVRTPQLQLAGNASIEAYVQSGLVYDSSWPTLPNKPLFPYTLDYLTDQECNIGSRCPNEAFNGFWVLPINDLNGNQKECDTLASCEVSGTAEEISNWLLNEIDTVRQSTRVPLTLLVNSYWFNFTQNSYEGFTSFLDRLTGYNDVFLVTQKQVYDWIRNPVAVENFRTDYPERNADCNAYSCRLVNQGGEDRYMQSCIPCPEVYPWLGNPDGNRP